MARKIAKKLQTIANNVQKVYRAGALQGIQTQEKTVTPSTEIQEVLPDEGYALSKVTVEPATEVYEAGKEQEWSDFWDGLQDYGNRTIYSSTFNRWKDAMFMPKYDIRPTTFELGFVSSSIKNLKQRLKDCGVVLDTSKCANMAQAFSNSSITHIPTIDSTGAAGLTNTFSGAEMIVEIEKLILKANGSQTLNSTFYYTSCLEKIEIEGTIGANVSFAQSSKLTHDSIMSIINALKDYTGTSETRTLTLHADAKARLTEAEIAKATEKGWSIA